MNKYLKQYYGADMRFEELNEKVIGWAHEKGIMSGSDPKSQLLKTVSEVGELADAVNKGNREETIDALGDVLVTMIILAEMKELDLTLCLQSAYDIIAKRKGTMINNVFVKEA